MEISFNTNLILQNKNIALIPLKESDFEKMYRAGYDPLIWEQHPAKDRWKIEVFRTYFNGAIESNGAFKIVDKKINTIIGCTRYYELSSDEKSIAIGFTFIKRVYWGTSTNYQVKKLMLDYAFSTLEKVKFYVGTNNFRSQKALEKLGVRKVAFNPKEDNILYMITKTEWIKKILNEN